MSTHINLSVTDEAVWKRFRALCSENGFTASGAFEKFMRNILSAANPKKALAASTEKLK
jgi:hypothetical protein